MITDSALAFADALPEGGVLIGLDLGTKTIGLATCDAGWRIATAGSVLPRGKFGKNAEAIATLIEQRKAAGIVLGLPRNMDGTESSRAQASRSFAQNLLAYLSAPPRSVSAPVLLWDERWSTLAAERDMIGQDFSRKKRASRIDSHAAAIILQGAIDAMTR